MKHIAIATLLLAFASVMLGQTNAPTTTVSNPVVSTVRQLEERQSKNLIGAAEEMPADKYSYHPTAEQMSFAHLVIHVIEANTGSCARVAGEPPRETKLKETDSKDCAYQGAEGLVCLLRASAGQGRRFDSWPAGVVPGRADGHARRSAHLSGYGLGRPLRRCRDVFAIKWSATA